MEQYTTLIMIALMVAAFYFLIMRPQRKRQQAIQQTLAALGPGDRVLLGSGVFGTIVEIGDKQAVLEVSPGVELTVLKQAIVRTVTDADEDSPELEDELDEGPEDEVVEPATAEVDAVPGYDDPADPGRTSPSAGADPKRLG